MARTQKAIVVRNYADALLQIEQSKQKRRKLAYDIQCVLTYLAQSPKLFEYFFNTAGSYEGRIKLWKKFQKILLDDEVVLLPATKYLVENLLKTHRLSLLPLIALRFEERLSLLDGIKTVHVRVAHQISDKRRESFKSKILNAIENLSIAARDNCFDDHLEQRGGVNNIDSEIAIDTETLDANDTKNDTKSSGSRSGSDDVGCSIIVRSSEVEKIVFLFEVDPTLIAGMIVQCDDYRLDLSMKQYFDALSFFLKSDLLKKQKSNNQGKKC